MRKYTPIFAAAFCAVFTAAGFAQAPAPSQQTAPANPDRAQNCTPTQAVPNDSTIAPQGSLSGQSSEPLTDKLAKSDGVLCPPPMPNSAIQVAPPSGGTMQVIPPPGSPGGDQSVRPK